MTSLLREEGTPIYNLNDFYIKTSDYFYEKYKSILEDKDIYIVIYKFYRTEEDTLKELTEKNFEVIEEVGKYDYTELPYLHYLDEWKIYKVKYRAEN